MIKLSSVSKKSGALQPQVARNPSAAFLFGRQT